MNVIENKKGFTLVELLAVIVVLAIIMVIASSSIGGTLVKARKSALAIEGTELINGAKNAYQLGILDGEVKQGAACYSLEYLYKEAFYSKGSGDNYTGSVLVTPNGNTVTYKYWISNGTYEIAGKGYDATNKDAVELSEGSAGASENCLGTTGSFTLFRWNVSSSKYETLNCPSDTGCS